MTEEDSPKKYNIKKTTIPEWQDWQADPQGRLCSFAHHLKPGKGEYQRLSPQGPLTHDEAQVHIHLLQPDTTNTHYYATLNTTEQRQAKRFKFAKDRELYTAAHNYVRQTLSRYADLAPQTWRFSNNAYGKPAITNPGYTSLCFNLSHTQGLIAVAVSRQRAVGVDVEQARTLQDLASLSQNVFAAPELADVLAHTGTAQQQRFFTYWTLKEAYIKARGMGLSVPLKQFYFTAGTAPTWHLQCDPCLNDTGGHWHCQAHCLTNHYHLAFAVDKRNPTIPNNI